MKCVCLYFCELPSTILHMPFSQIWSTDLWQCFQFMHYYFRFEGQKQLKNTQKLNFDLKNKM